VPNPARKGEIKVEMLLSGEAFFFIQLQNRQKFFIEVRLR